MKRIVCIFMAAALALSGLTVFSAETLLGREDIPIAETEIAGLVKLGIMQGASEPEGLVTRREAVHLINDTVRPVLYEVDFDQPPFKDDTDYTIVQFYATGFVSGRGNRIFDPDAPITGKEFTKIMLAAMGYYNVTLDDAYDRGVECGLLINNFTKSVVNDNMPLLRSDAARLCWAALTAKDGSGVLLYRRLINNGTFKKSDFEGLLFTADSSKTDESPETFADKLNSYMPTDQNYMFSPLSIKMALALAANGAEGETRDEILEACGIDDLDAFNQQSKDMIEKYIKTDVIRLDIANSIWLNEDQTPQHFSEEYKELVGDYFSAEAGIVNNDTAVPTINGWVSDKTNGLIDGIISEDNKDFASALVNAIYFKARWANEFDEKLTKPEDFTDANGNVTQIDFMHKTGYFGYYGDDSVQIVRLPYRGYEESVDERGMASREVYDDLDVSMYVLIGDEKLENVETLLANSELRSTMIALSMPKFKTEFTAILNDTLNEMGINRAFTPGLAQFEKMFDIPDFNYFGDVIHKTYIDVNEKDTEAAAVTTILMPKATAARMYELAPLVVKLDRPFTYVIRDNITGDILFMGQYSFAEM